MSGDNNIHQAAGLWFSNHALIVLRAEDRVFRVQKVILAARSPVFQAMFEFPQPIADGDEIMEGSPVVRLHDSADQVEPFLRAIFDSSYFMPHPANIEFFAVLGILQLAHKYDVNYLFKRALHHLETVYPIEFTKHGPIDSENPLGYDQADPCHDLYALPILHEVNATWLLPCAYYTLSTFPPEDLFDAGDS